MGNPRHGKTDAMMMPFTPAAAAADENLRVPRQMGGRFRLLAEPRCARRMDSLPSPCSPGRPATGHLLETGSDVCPAGDE